MYRRRFLHSALMLPLLAGLPAAAPAAAGEWPTQPVHILVSFPPGGASDLVARLLAQHLSEDLGQQFVVENKPGAAGTIAANALKVAPADGHTLMLSNLTPFSIAPSLLADAPYDPVADFTHVSYIGGTHLGLFVRQDRNIADLAAFVAAAKAEPGVLDYGSSGVGSWGHVVAERFKALAGVSIEHIPYQGSGPMVLDFRADVIGAIFDAVPQNLPLVKEGVAVPLAVSAKERLETLPDVPTFKELGYDLEAENWLGISAPAGLSPDIAEKLDAAVKRALEKPEVAARFSAWGIDVTAKANGRFADFVTAQYAAWKTPVEAVRGQ
ncbi:tripartite tricarboxylate transporter substrate binding protein [Shinella sp. HZN7]|jgi:tripartite-type tricarboxylate transporter receptor subunit TctC|uniref:Bug family tripartite tricarboxylate transporter substrate binding protein n=1 Tax=Shinella sp. (strain HZN7) TaxID=879274 RepID=UPI0007DA9F61|nr:tripartite tricarboxylate transporter substrate binding protein [Shinella sp. HZN7]ANH08179.1 hypothetical protein shn_29095 [Shinella sp. HZN7]